MSIVLIILFSILSIIDIDNSSPSKSNVLWFKKSQNILPTIPNEFTQINFLFNLLEGYFWDYIFNSFNQRKLCLSKKIIFNINKDFLKYFASKGSVSVDGVSLTVNDVDKNYFTVNIVPYTWSHTSFKNYKTGTIVNIEIDILARYLESLNANK